MPLPILPKGLQDLTREIKDKEREVKDLRAADRTTYKTYVRARTKLMSKKHRYMQSDSTKKWYSLWVKCADELQALVTQMERAESELADLRQRRAERVARDRVDFERELLRR